MKAPSHRVVLKALSQLFPQSSLLLGGVAALFIGGLIATATGSENATVPGTANLWLAGQPDGTVARQADVAPTHSPVLLPGTLTPGKDLTFSVTGGTLNAAGTPGNHPDGFGANKTHIAENGLPDMTAPLNALVGVFLDSSTPAEPAPSPSLNFGVDANRDYEVLTPGLRQPFFIGNGQTAAATTQRVRVPAGATRLYLGSMDEDNNVNNVGSMSVTVTEIDPAALVLPTPEFSLDSDVSTALPYYARNEWIFRARLAQPPTLPADTTVRLQYSSTPAVEGSWTDVPGGQLDNNGDLTGIGTAQTWLVRLTQVPADTAVNFRVIAAAAGCTDTVSVVRGPYEIPGPAPLAPADHLGVYPEKNKGHTIGRRRQIWNFQAATFTDGDVVGLSVRVQASQTPAIESSWQDLAGGAVMTKAAKKNYWTLDTLITLPAGNNYFFRTVSSAPGRLDAASDPVLQQMPIYTVLDSGEFQFDRTGFYVQENGGTVVLRVNRIGGSYEKVKVNITALSQSALVGKDFAKLSKTLTFADGETTQTVDLSITDDSLIEGDETFTVELSKPTGGAFLAATRTVATIKIFDNDTGGTPIPAFTGFSVTGPQGGRNGEPWKFTASIPATTPGLSLRVQSSFTPNDASSWTDLPGGGVMKLKKNDATLDTSILRVGNNSFRVVATAPGYQERISTVITATVLAPAPRQEPTIFGAFFSPISGQNIKSGVPFEVSIPVSDTNGLQAVTLEYSTNGKSFKPYPNGNLALNGFVYKISGVTFNGGGDLYIQVKALDGATPNVATTSPMMKLDFGLGGGTSSPTFGAFKTEPAAGPFDAGSNLKVLLPVQDDKQLKDVVLFVTDSAGNVRGRVGDMGATKNGYQWNFIGLNAGSFYFKVAATDYDGNTVYSPNFGPYDVDPPLAPVYLNVAQASRHVPPKPKFKDTNDETIPDQVNGKVTVEFSNIVPPMDLEFVPVDENRQPQAVLVKPAGSLKVASGSVTFDAPQEPGLYQLRTRKKGKEAPTDGRGELIFRVGIPFNYYYTFKDPTPDFGLYWFRSETNGLKAIPGGHQNDDYFSPDRPTVVYVHGWQQRVTSTRSRENWKFVASKDNSVYNLCTLWRNQGYNVGIFYWNPFADDVVENKRGGGAADNSDIVPYRAEAKIYGTTGELNNQPAGMGMSYRYLKADGKTVVNEYDASRFADTNVADLLRSAWIEAFADYPAHRVNRELRLVAHSLGTQLSARAMDLLRVYPVDGVPLPTRLALLEIAETDNSTLPGFEPDGLPHAGTPPREWQLRYLKGLRDANVAIESYRTTDLQNLLGIRGFVTLSNADTKPLHDVTAFCRLQADSYGWDKIVQLHGESIRWYFKSFEYTPLPANTYDIFGNPTYFGDALSASSTWTYVRNHMGGKSEGSIWFEQREGKPTLSILDDQFEKKNR